MPTEKRRSVQAAGATQDKNAQRRGGQSSRGASGSTSARGAATDKSAQRRGGQHSHGGR